MFTDPPSLIRLLNNNKNSFRFSSSLLSSFRTISKIVTELSNPSYALCGKSKESALKYNQLGNQYFSNADYVKALDYYTQALRRAPFEDREMENNLVATLYINRATILHLDRYYSEDVVPKLNCREYSSDLDVEPISVLFDRLEQENFTKTLEAGSEYESVVDVPETLALYATA